MHAPNPNNALIMNYFCNTPPITNPTTCEQVAINWMLLNQMHSAICDLLNNSVDTRLNNGRNVNGDLVFDVLSVNSGTVLSTVTIPKVFTSYSTAAGSPPALSGNEVIGSIHQDTLTGDTYIFNGTAWTLLAQSDGGGTLVDNGDNSYTYTDSLSSFTFLGSGVSGDVGNSILAGTDGLPFFTHVPSTITDNGDGTITHNNGIISTTIAKSLLADNGDGTLTFDSGNGTPITFTEGVIPNPSTDANNSIVAGADGLPYFQHIPSTVTDNGDGTITHNNGITSVTFTVGGGAQSDWNETDNTAESFILNKPTIPTNASQIANTPAGDLASTDVQGALNELQSDITALSAASGEVNVQSDWTESNTSSDAFIANKPTIPTTAGELPNVPTGNMLSTDIQGAINELQGDIDAINATGAEANVQSDWNQSDNTSDSFILNKPTIPTDAAQIANTPSGDLVATDVQGALNELQGDITALAAASGDPNVQSDWNETSTTSDAFILNKPTIPTTATDLANVPTGNMVATDIQGAVNELQGDIDAINAIGAEANVQSDWNETDNTSDAFILNKPVVQSAAITYETPATFSGTSVSVPSLTTSSDIVMVFLDNAFLFPSEYTVIAGGLTLNNPTTDSILFIRFHN